MNRLGLSDEKTKEYIEKAKDLVKKAIERKDAVERRGEIYPGELNMAIQDIKDHEEMLKILQDNK